MKKGGEYYTNYFSHETLLLSGEYWWSTMLEQFFKMRVMTLFKIYRNKFNIECNILTRSLFKTTWE